LPNGAGFYSYTVLLDFRRVFFNDCHKRGLAVLIGEYGAGKGDLGTHRSVSGGEDTEYILVFDEEEWTYKEITFTLNAPLLALKILFASPDDVDFFFDDIEFSVVTGNN